ncbi:MAG: hypothetical protein CVU39_25730 [Chloroflexi bacterium HGW-Chloroflexi-10]|nr:MAG: hypothetical protein CVU39_25730 [Chloroflexi bacterium HGW-Chloroflexi-10]
MSIEKYQAQVKSSVWKAIAQSGVMLKDVPLDEQNKFVDILSDNLLVTVNEILDETVQPAKANSVADSLEGEEQILWEGRPFLSIVEYYTITNERIKTIKGFLGKDIENFEMIRVQDIDVNQNLSERMLGIGDITITGADASNPTIVLRNIHKPHEVYELLRKAWLAARKKYGLIFREEM